MKKLLSFLLLVNLVFPQSRNATITLYKDGFGLVKQPVSFNLAKGRNKVKYPSLPDEIEPHSSFLTLHGAEVIFQKYNHDVFDTFDFLKAHLGKQVTVTTNSGNSFKGKLMDIDGKWLTVGSRNTVRIFNLEEVMDIAAGKHEKNPSVKPELEWEINSPEKSQVVGELIYISGGFDWDANYRLITAPDEKTGTLISQAIIKNETNLNFSSANLELVEGELKRLHGQRSARTGQWVGRTKRSVASVDMMPDKGVVFDQESLGDYVFYSLSAKISLPKKESISVSLYHDSAIEFSRLYRFENNERALREEPLFVEISFINSDKNGLGVPLPAGAFQIYQQTSSTAGETAVKFTGEDFLSQVAINEKAKVIAGRAFDVLGKRTVMNYDRKKKSEEASILLEIKNKRDDVINVQITEHILGDWVIREPSHNYKKTDAQTIQFEFSLKPQSTETITYTYRKEWQ